MSNKLFIIVVVILLVMTGYVLILSNHSNINNNLNIKNNKINKVFIVNPNATLTPINSSVLNSVTPDTTNSSNYWVIEMNLTYPTTWFPYFTYHSSNSQLGYYLYFRFSINNNYSTDIFWLDTPINSNTYTMDTYSIFLLFFQDQINYTSIITFSFQLQQIINGSIGAHNIPINVNNLTMSNRIQTVVLQGLPYGDYIPGSYSTSTFSQVLFFNLFYPILNNYKVTFSGINKFSININNNTFSTNKGNITLYLPNGSYSYNISYLNQSFSSNFLIAGNNVNIDISLTVFLSSPSLDFFTYLILIFIMLITILHFTRGSMIFLSFSSFLFIYIGYKLNIAFFTINLILLFILIFSALISYKVFLE